MNDETNPTETPATNHSPVTPTAKFPGTGPHEGTSEALIRTRKAKSVAHTRKATTAKKPARKADRPKADRTNTAKRTDKKRAGAPQIPWNKGKKTGIKPWNAGKKLPYKVWNAGKKTGIKPWNKGKKIAQSTKPNTAKKTTKAK